MSLSIGLKTDFSSQVVSDTLGMDNPGNILTKKDLVVSEITACTPSRLAWAYRVAYSLN